jgi:hypothetical protein
MDESLGRSDLQPGCRHGFEFHEALQRRATKQPRVSCKGLLGSSLTRADGADDSQRIEPPFDRAND